MADVESVVFQVENCEKSELNGCFRENGQHNGKTKYCHVKGERYIFRTQNIKDGEILVKKLTFDLSLFCVPSLSGDLGTILFGSTDTQTPAKKYVSSHFGVSCLSVTF